MRCRKDFLDLSAAERNRLAAAFNDVYDRGVIASMAQQHDDYFNNGVHWGPAFLPWHRHLLLRIEAELRSFDARVTLPYWDWTRPAARDLDAEPWLSFFGGRANNGGHFDHWDYERASAPSGTLPTLDTLLDELQAGTFAEFRTMECGSHTPGHTWTGGTMNTARSPADPLFFLHHNNVDRLWAIWQRSNSGVAQYDDTNHEDCRRVDAAFVAVGDAMVGGATPSSMLDHTALGYWYPRDERLESRAAERGLPVPTTGDPISVVVDPTSVTFNDVPEGETTKRAARFVIEGCASLVFSVESGPSGPYELFEPGPFPFPASPFPTDELRIWLVYTAGSPGPAPDGEMIVVAHDPDGNEVFRATIPITGTSVPRPRVAAALVLDESGSMLYNAGNNRTRLQVLQLAATTFIDQLFDDNGIALVSFDETATALTDLQDAGPLTGLVRNEARGEIVSHGPPDEYPHTSIGAGVLRAAELYNTAPNTGDFDIHATIVFTDGFEDREPWLEDVEPFADERIYAIGVGDAAHTNNQILRQIAEQSGGFMNVTGAIAIDDEFLLEKFFLQVLAGVTNRDIVRDPPGVITPGTVERVPFQITRSDISMDAVALSRYPQLVVIGLEAPDGTVLTEAHLPPGSLRAGRTSNAYRVTFPIVTAGDEHWDGRWHLLLAGGRRQHSHDTHRLAALGVAAGVSVPYHALVHVHSNLRLRATVSQTQLTPGATLHLRAVLTEYGQPLEPGADVTAGVTAPDGTTSTVSLARVGPGQYEASFVGTQTGAYRFLVHAAGLSSRGQPYTREYLLSAVLGSPKGPRPTDPDRPREPWLCDLLDCLDDAGLWDGAASKWLERLGLDPDRLRQCLEHDCAQFHPRPTGVDRSRP